MNKLAQEVWMDSCILTEDFERWFTNTKHTNVICRGISANESKQRCSCIFQPEGLRSHYPMPQQTLFEKCVEKDIFLHHASPFQCSIYYVPLVPLVEI